MNMRWILITLTLLFALTACNLTQVLPRPDLTMTLVDSSTVAPDFNSSQIRVGVSTDDTGAFDGFVFFPNRLKVFANAGSMGARITGYSVDYFYAGGEQVSTATGESYRGSLGLNVPDGIVCSIPRDGPADDCDVNSTDAVFEKGPDVFSTSFYAIDSDIANTLFFGAAPEEGASAFITVEGTDNNGNFFSQLLSPVTINFFAVE